MKPFLVLILLIANISGDQPDQPNFKSQQQVLSEVGKLADLGARLSLRGFKGVGLSLAISAIEGERKHACADEKILKTAFELCLRTKGIRVFDLQNPPHDVGILSARAIVVRVGDPDGACVFHFELEFRQWCQVVDHPEKVCFAVTWHDGVTALAGDAHGNLWRDAVENLTSRFANDFLAENPPSTASQPSRP